MFVVLGVQLPIGVFLGFYRLSILLKWWLVVCAGKPDLANFFNMQRAPGKGCDVACTIEHMPLCSRRKSLEHEKCSASLLRGRAWLLILRMLDSVTPCCKQIGVRICLVLSTDIKLALTSERIQKFVLQFMMVPLMLMGSPRSNKQSRWCVCIYS